MKEIDEPTHPFYRTADDAIWTCSVCGIVEPQYARFNGFWLRRVCECQREEERRKKREEERKSRDQFLLQSAFEWLGPDWSDSPLAFKTFENFETVRQPEAVASAEMFLQLMEGTLILHGSFGTGKTHILAALCNRLREWGKPSRFTTAPNLFRAIQQRIQHHEDYNGIIAYASSTPLLVLDDIDKAKWSEHREEVYFAIIDKRVLRGLPTAISTNRADELASFVGGAVYSRLFIGQIAVEMNGQDYRKLL